MQNTTLNHAIHRFHLTSKKAVVQLPSGARVTAFAPSSKGGFNLWAVVCTDEGVKTEKRAFAVVATGEAIPAAAAVAAQPAPPITVMMPQGPTFLTLFEVEKANAADWKGFGDES